MRAVIIGLALLAAIVYYADEIKATPLSEPVTSTVSTQPLANMTEEEVRAKYLERFRMYCRNETACSDVKTSPILEVINGRTYNLTTHICLWGDPKKSCPNLCVLSKQINCLGKPRNPACENECYWKCNKTNAAFSEPFGNFWSICNSTEESIAAAVQPSTQPQVTAELPNPSTSQQPVINCTHLKHTTTADLLAECWKRSECWGLISGLSILTACLLFGMMFIGVCCSDNIRARCPCFTTRPHRPIINDAAIPLINTECPECRFKFGQNSDESTNATNEGRRRRDMNGNQGQDLSQPRNNRSKGRGGKIRRRTRWKTV